MGKREIVLRILKLLNLLLIPLPFVYGWAKIYEPMYIGESVNNENIIVILVYYLLYYLFARVYDAFLVSLTRISEMVYSQALAALFSDCILLIVLAIAKMTIPAIWPMALVFVAQLAMAAMWSLGAHKFYFASFAASKTALVYVKDDNFESLISAYGLEKRFNVSLKLNVEECLADLHQLDGFQVVFLKGVHSHERNIILKHCVANGIVMYLLPRIGDVIMSGAAKMHMFHLPFLRVGRYNPTPEYVITKRVFDIISSLAVLIVISPIMLGTAIAIKMHDGGPVFYKQRRLTKDGEIFDVLKFRSMRVDAEKDGVARLSSGENDDRITPVGHFIRKCRIDELPQLINIIMGDMSVVGPRPERPEIAVQYEKEIPEFALRLQAKAGLTGYAQVYGKYNTTPYDKLQMDLMYISNPSFMEDLRIIFATIKILFIADSTEGVAEGKETAM